MLNRPIIPLEQAQAHPAPGNSVRLKVLHVGKFYPPHHGGMETHLRGLCEQLSNHVELDVIVANDGRTTTSEIIGGVKVTRLRNLFNFASSPVCPELVDRIRSSRADIIHIHLPNPAAMLAWQASRAKGALVFTHHSDIVRQRVLGRAFAPIMKRTLGRACAIIATSPNYLESSNTLKPHRERCHVIPFGIPFEPYQTVDINEVERLRLTFGPRIILAVGRLVYYKGFEFLIRAMDSVDGHLIIVGDGPLRAKLRSLAIKCGVAGRVSVLTGVEDVTPFYHVADVFALPSIARSEAFGIVQLEAMACGAPIVNTSLNSGVPFVSPHRVSGLTVPPSNPGALAVALNNILDDHNLRAQLGRDARLRVQREFSMSLMLDRTLALYNKIAGTNA